MAKQSIPAQPAERTIQYSNLLGVDYQSDATEVSRNRSPEMVNMISDLGGNPVKRYGYRRISSSSGGAAGGMYLGFATVDGDDWAVRLAPQGTTPETYKVCAAEISINEHGEISETSAKILSDRTNTGEIKHVLGFQTSLYVLCENEWLEYNTSTDTVKALGVNEGTLWDYVSSSKIGLNMPDEKFIPTTATMYKPNGQELVTLPAGTDLTGATEGVNMLTPFRRVEYCVTTDTAQELVFVVPNCAKMSPVLMVEVLSPTTFDWVRVGITDYVTSATTLVSCRRPDGNRNDTTDVIEGKISFTATPYVSVEEDGYQHLMFRSAISTRVPAGIPNVRITYAPFDTSYFNDNIYNGYYRAARAALFASNAVEMFDSRLFAAYGIHTYYSRASSLFKMDDNFYFDVDNDVVAYAKSMSHLAIVSEDTGKNTIYIASGEYNEDYGMTVYTMRASNSGIGAVSNKVSGTLNDEPLFLSNTGVFGMSTNYMSEKYAVNRSGKINKRLCKEQNLNTAVGIAYNGYFYLALNGHMYVMDGRHRDKSKNGDNSYECYYFDNLPVITDMYIVDNRMYFSDGTYLYTWNDDMEEQYQYLDNAVMDPNTFIWHGEPVKAKWCSVVDSDGSPMYYKTLSKKGTMITVSPPMQTSCQVTIVKDQYEEYYVGRFNGSTFALSHGVYDAFTKKKIKKYKRLQFVIENNEAEPFGVVSVIKTYTIGNFAKR